MLDYQSKLELKDLNETNKDFQSRLCDIDKNINTINTSNRNSIWYSNLLN